ncbi:hypothetical protein [Phycicoccus sonneratiae]|uniref:Uncharacterized protein n=1 Tax=Phycicoccus sonneratiae TaxID=2807628 RepID=A0ABS2CT94_9MICO|nr:hypothetical protein [Phycicoccus sonneraticus]MBM6402371.1 hypothetical protein [Phycicoccus sonneraticus]
MSATHTHPTRGSRPARRLRPAPRSANLGGLVVNLVLLYLVNERPGWDAVPFLTGDTPLVLPLVNAALWTGVVVEALAVLLHTPGFRALGDLVTSAVGLTATLRVWDVFPFDLTSGWHLVARGVLVLAVVGGVVGIVAALVRLLGSPWRPQA